MKRAKLDLTKEYKSYYTAKTTPEIVEIEEGKFLAVKGKCAPGGEEFQAKVDALYSLAYGVKMLMKKSRERISRLQNLRVSGGLILINHGMRFLEKSGNGNFSFVCLSL